MNVDIDIRVQPYTLEAKYVDIGDVLILSNTHAEKVTDCKFSTASTDVIISFESGDSVQMPRGEVILVVRTSINCTTKTRD